MIGKKQEYRLHRYSSIADGEEIGEIYLVVDPEIKAIINVEIRAYRRNSYIFFRDFLALMENYREGGYIYCRFHTEIGSLMDKIGQRLPWDLERTEKEGRAWYIWKKEG